MTASNSSRLQSKLCAKDLEWRPIRDASTVEHSDDNSEECYQGEDDGEGTCGKREGEIKDELGQGPTAGYCKQETCKG